MNTEGLLKLADALKNVPVERFDMATWGTSFDSCGFAGCAIGWGFKLKVLPEAPKINFDFKGNPFLGVEGFLFLGFEAVGEAFCISREQAEFIFGEMSYIEEFGHTEITPEMVADRIRNFVKDQTQAEEWIKETYMFNWTE